MTIRGLLAALASMAGVRVLMDGGNAADAVLATLNLTEPMNSGAGGNGFMTTNRASDRVNSNEQPIHQTGFVTT